MSRLLLPLLRSRTAHSLRPLPGCRPRGAAGAPALLLRPPPALAAAATALAPAPRPSRGLGTHPKREPIEALNTAQGARDFIYSLHSTERSCLLKELHRFESIAIAQGLQEHIGMTVLQGYCKEDSCSAHRYPKPEIALMQRVKQATSTESPNGFEKLEAPPPSQAQLRYVFIHNALPFVGFGFLDNAIMIVAGTQIEMSIGIIFGISTMAAAALGNLVSDLAGLGLAGYVEALASRLGLSIPDLTPKQVDMWQTRVSAHLGKGVGVAIGCILGMLPLLFFRGEEEEKKLEEKN
ncbi:transmembrane protein 65 isoform X1 [Trichosurus vulpecula]|uniref:transmembrane protein 65 isoform X1 n=1 Tax=Trichosurus vulpecula TaxID=9337 RepID=UPI00186B1874|nr:transmembrane protein 65 isoform X1 [Trichosurus vulpecula]